MADLKVGTTVGGSPVWHQGNLALVPSGNAILYKGARIYSENDKPSANELQVVSRAGDTMTGMLNVETSTDYQLALKSSVSGSAYIRFLKGNTLQSYIGTDTAGDFKVAMTDTNGSWAFDGLKIAKSNGDVSLKGSIQSIHTGNFDIKYGAIQFIRANSSKDVYIGAPGGTDLVLGYARDGMTTAKIRIDSAVYNKTGGLLISDAGLIQRSAMDNPYYNQTESDSRFIRLNVNTATNGYLLSKPSNIGTSDNLSMGYSGFFRHNGLGGFSGLTINVSHPDLSNAGHARGITFDYGGTGYGMYTYAYNAAGTKLANQKIYTEADKPTPAEIGALAAGANAVSASKLQTARTISLTGGATGSVSFDGSANVSLTVAVTNDSHTHSDYVKKIGDSMSGNLTVPKVLLSAAQGTEANSVARRDFVESTVTASGKGVKDLTIALPAGAPTTGYIPVLFKTYGTSNSFVFIDTLSNSGQHPMNNCSFIGNVRASGWTDSGSYAYGMFTIHSESERAIHSIHGPSESVNGFVVYVETRAFPITVRVDVGTTVTAYATDVTYGTSVFKVNGQVSGNTKTVIFANFDKGTGTYNGSNRVYDNGYNPTPEAVGALPANGNAVTASRLQTARLIAGVPFDGTSNISISATNVGAVAKAGDTMTGALVITKSDDAIILSPVAGTASYILGQQGGIADWYVGKGSSSKNDILLHSYTHGTGLTLQSDRISFNKPAYTQGYKVLSELDEKVWKNRGQLSDLGLASAVLPGYFSFNPGASSSPDNATYGHGFAVNPGSPGANSVWSSQFAITHGTPNKLWHRSGINGAAQGNWKKIYTSDDKPTAAELGVVSRSGDTMSGNLTVPKVLVSGAQGTEVNALTRKDYVDSEVAKKLSLAGGTMTGALYVNEALQSRSLTINDISSGARLVLTPQGSNERFTIDMYPASSSPYQVMEFKGSDRTVSFKQIVSCDAAPVAASHLTRKDYVDGQVGTRAPTAHTHTAADVGAVNKTGDTMTGALYTPALRVADGNIDIYHGGPHQMLQFHNPGVAAAMIYQSSSNLIFCRGNGSWGNTNTWLVLNNSGANFNGIVAAPDFNVTSDRRLKSNFKAIDNPLSKVEQLTGQIYDKKLKDGAIVSEAGLIAQDVQKVQPMSVREGDDGMLSISPSGIVALLVEAVKELSERIKVLESK